MSNYPHLASRLFNVPIAIAPQKAEIVMAALADRFGIAKLFRQNEEAVMLSGGGAKAFLDGMDGSNERAEYKPYEVLSGIALIPVEGTLVQKLGCMRPWSGMTGYDGIRASLSMAMNDESVRAIVLDVDSPGGEVAGCFDLVDAIYAARGTKTIWSICTESAFSAGYAIASAATKVIVPRTGGTGSVGVICMHVDLSKALAKEGIDVTLIHFGAKKADGAASKPLSATALDRFQSDVDTMGNLFCNTVARNRKLSAGAVKATEAGCFLGAAGVDIGFADAVMAPDEAFASLLDELG